MLQLDARIAAAFRLLPDPSGLFVWKTDPVWNVSNPCKSLQSSNDLLDAVLRAIGVRDGPGVLEFEPSERLLVLALAYLTNRWARGLGRGIYIVPKGTPDGMLYFCPSTESIFIICRTKSVHDDFVERLTAAGVPAYGPLIASPYIAPPYPDIELGSTRVTVDRTTGKPTGNGSEESVLLPEYLPPGAV